MEKDVAYGYTGPGKTYEDVYQDVFTPAAGNAPGVESGLVGEAFKSSDRGLSRTDIVRLAAALIESGPRATTSPATAGGSPESRTPSGRTTATESTPTTLTSPSESARVTPAAIPDAGPSLPARCGAPAAEFDWLEAITNSNRIHALVRINRPGAPLEVYVSVEELRAAATELLEAAASISGNWETVSAAPVPPFLRKRLLP
jgi:hypothetical protein